MANYRAANSFAQNFIAGFSFVDDIYSRRRQEEMLKQRLDEERKEREFRRTMDAQRNAREAGRYETERQNEADRRARQATLDESNRRIAEVGGDISRLSDEEIARYSTVNPRIQAELDRNRQMRERIDAIRTTQGIAQGGLVQGVTGGVAGGAGADQQQTSAVQQEAEAASEGAMTLFEPAATLQRVTEEDISALDPEYQEKGMFGRAFDVMGGQVSQTARALQDTIVAPFSAAESGVAAVRGYSRESSQQNIGQEFTGDVMLPADRFYTPEELSQITDPAERERARLSSVQVIEEAKAAARNPNRNVLARAATGGTRQGAVSAGAELAFQEPIERQQRQAVASFTEFVNEPQSRLQTLAVNDPAAAAQQYFKQRNTVFALNPELAQAADARMVPVLTRYEQQLRTEAERYAPGSKEQARYLQSLANVQFSRREIANSQKPVAEQAGVRGGLRIGDQQRIQNVQAVANDPQRPRVPMGARPAAQTRSAATVATRITPNTRRLSDKQIESLIILKDEGMIDDATFQTVLMTGAWPPGKDPNSVKSISTVNGYAVAMTEGGGWYVIPELSNPDPKKATPGGDNEPVDRTFTQDKLDTIVAGAKIHAPSMTPEYENGIRSFILDYAPRLRQSHFLDNEENLLLLGKVLMQAQELAHESANDGIFGWGGAKERTTEELFFNSQLRKEYAAEFDRRLVNIPERLLQQDYDAEAIRSELLTSGILRGVVSDEVIEQMGEADLIWIANVLFQDASEFGKE